MIRTALVLTLCLAVPGAALAQSVAPGPFGGASERRITAGITIPFGTTKRSSAGAPRLELGIDRANADRRDPLLVLPVEEQFRRTRIGVTLDRSPRLMVNGREAVSTEHRSNLSTGATVAIGVAVVVIIGALVLRERLEASSD